MEQLLLFEDVAPILSISPGGTGSDNEVGRVKAAFEAATDYSSLAASGIPFPGCKDVVLAALEQDWQIALPRAQHLSIKEIRKVHPNAYKPWSVADEQVLIAMHRNGCSLQEMAAALGRQPGAITARLNEVERCKKRGLPCGGSNSDCPFSKTPFPNEAAG